MSFDTNNTKEFSCSVRWLAIMFEWSDERTGGRADGRTNDSDDVVVKVFLALFRKKTSLF